MISLTIDLASYERELTSSEERIRSSYWVRGGENSHDAYTFARAQVPSVNDGLPLTSFLLTRQRESEHGGDRMYHTVAAVWSRSFSFGGTPSPEPNDEYEFSVDPSPARITQALATASSHGAPLDPSDFQNLIGVSVSEDGLRIEGTDSVDPTARLRFTKTFPRTGAGSFGTAQAAALADLAGSINSDMYSFAQPGEMRFMGASAVFSADSVSVTYVFEYRKNRTNETVGDILVPARKGWQLLDTFSTDVANQVLGGALRVPIYVRVLDVYPSVSFSASGIPLPPS